MSDRALASIFALALLGFVQGCVSTIRYRHDIRRVYRDGFHVGRVVGRDDILAQLKSSDCFQQQVDALMNPDPKQSDDEAWLEKSQRDLESVKGKRK